jgi:hypothetical protein
VPPNISSLSPACYYQVNTSLGRTKQRRYRHPFFFLVHNAHRITLKGASMRRRNARPESTRPNDD